MTKQQQIDDVWNNYLCDIDCMEYMDHLASTGWLFDKQEQINYMYENNAWHKNYTEDTFYYISE